jgi:hypothetical protein
MKPEELKMKQSHGGLLLAAIMLSACTAPAVQPSTANIGGIWRIVANTPSGTHEADMYVSQSGREISGRFEGALGVMHYTGTIDDREIRFAHNAMAGAMRFDYEGTVGPDAMKGTAVFGTLGTGTWVATREGAQ